MPIIYQHQPDEALGWINTPFGDENGGWGDSVSKFAAVAIVSAAAIVSSQTLAACQVFSYHQDDPAGNLHGIYEDDAWQNPQARAVPGTNFVRLPYLPDLDELPAGHLYIPPDEDYWRNPVFPVTWPNLVPQQWMFDVQEPAGSLYIPPDEDGWQNPFQPAPIPWVDPQPYSFDSGDFAVAVTFQPDEDYPPPFPAPSAISYFRFPFADHDEIPAGNLYIPPDEDYRYISGLCIPPANFVARPFLDPEELPAGSLFTPPDEDYPYVPRFCLAPTNTFPQPSIFDIQEPAGSLYVPPDEDYLFRAGAQTFPLNLWPQQFAFEQNDLAALFFDEEPWFNLPQAAPIINFQRLPYAIDADDFVSSAPFALAEDAFIPNPLFPGRWANVYPQQYGFDSADIPPQGELNAEATVIVQLAASAEEPFVSLAIQPPPPNTEFTEVLPEINASGSVTKA